MLGSLVVDSTRISSVFRWINESVRWINESVRWIYSVFRWIYSACQCISAVFRRISSAFPAKYRGVKLLIHCLILRKWPPEVVTTCGSCQLLAEARGERSSDYRSA